MKYQGVETEIPKKSWLSTGLLKIQNKKQNTAYLYLILTFFTVSFFGFFVLRPAFTTISGLQKQLGNYKLIHNGLQDKLLTIQKLDSEYATVQTEVPLIYEAIPNTPQIPILAREIEKLSEKDNVYLQSFLVSTVELYPLESGNFSFTVEVLGTEQNINSFIESLSNFSRVITIDKISSGKTDEGDMELSVTGKAFFTLK